MKRFNIAQVSIFALVASSLDARPEEPRVAPLVLRQFAQAVPQPRTNTVNTKEAADLVRQLDRLKEFEAGSSGSTTDEIKKRAVTVYNRTCQAGCVEMCADLFKHVFDQPGLARVCR